MKDNSLLLLGVDGGGTQTTVAACDCSGEYLGSVNCESINYNAIGMKKARENMAIGIDRILRKIGRKNYHFITIGHSGLDDVATEEEKTTFAETIIDKNKLYMLSDADVALKGGTLGSSGMLIISGTGAMGVAIDQAGKKHVAGGWGYLLYDEGSGFAIGMGAIKSAVRDFERGVASPLEEAVKSHFNVNELRAVIPVIYAEDFLPSSIASLAIEVTKIAKSGNIEAQRILKNAAGELAALYFSLLLQAKGALDGAPVYVYGSILQKCQIVRNEFERLVREHDANTLIASPRLTAECGSLIFSAEKCGLSNATFLQTLENSYKRYLKNISH